MEKKVQDYIKQNNMLATGDRLVMGVSGGADSVCLLCLFASLQKEYSLNLFVVHVNHGIRKEAAQRDANYVRKLCKSFNVPFFLFEADIPQLAKQEKMSEEEMGRVYRYRCFYQVMEEVKANKIAVAHHSGDQAETVLFHLVRGSNLVGMSGMKAVQGKIIRPLLCLDKKEIKDYLVQKHIVWQEDATNADNDYTRNRLRNQVIPRLLEVNDKAVAHIAEFADLMGEYETFFKHQIELYLTKWVKFKEDGCEANRKVLCEQDRVLIMGVLYQMIIRTCKAQKDITREHVEAVFGLLTKQSGKSICLPYETMAMTEFERLIVCKGHTALTDKQMLIGRVSIEDILQCTNQKKKIQLPNGDNLFLEIKSVNNISSALIEKNTSVQNIKNNYTKYFDCDTIKDTLDIRTHQKDDFFIMNEKGNRKKLSRYFIDCKLPVSERENAIVVALGNEILWVVGQRRSENYKVTDNTTNVLIMMYEGDSDERSNRSDDFGREG